MANVIFDEDKCKGCGLCEDACPRNIIVRQSDKLNAKGFHPVGINDTAKCIGCAFCALMCPDAVITVEK